MTTETKKTSYSLFQSNKSILLQWSIWFFVGNILLFWIIGSNYLFNIPWVDTPYLNNYGKNVLRVFAGFSFVGHLGLLAMVPAVIPIVLLAIFPKRNFILPIAIIIATLAATLLIIDSVTYRLYHFHLNGLIIDIVANGLSTEVFGISKSEYVVTLIVSAIILVIETLYGIGLWRFFLKKNTVKKSYGYVGWLGLLIGFSLYISYGMIVFSAKSMLVRAYIDVSHFIPLYTEVFGAILPIKEGRVCIERIAETCLVQTKKINLPLNYPIQPLAIHAPSQPKNLVVIAVDTWRFDMLTQKVMPTLNHLSKNSWVFVNHFSGGNATGPGIFSLFYGLPASYWTAMEEQHRGPLLIDALKKLHYQMGIFSSASLRLPSFNQTVFLNVDNLKLQTPGQSPYDRDKRITQEFTDFVSNAVKHPQPFFSFLFYDASHSYCSFDDDLLPFQPAIKNCNRLELTNDSDPIPYLNRYKNALVLVDEQIKQVIDTLKANHVYDNTVIIITGDHGEEFNDNHQNFWGHASNFTRYQVQTPLIIHWPGKKPKLFTHQTTHLDVVPTLMKLLLGDQTAPSNYCLGRSLFDSHPRPYLIIGSYVGLGVLEADRITNISQTGNFRMEELNGKATGEIKLDLPVIRLVFKDIHRFYKLGTEKVNIL